ncbi:MAG TPA: hypothetical protein VFP84_03690 [Kofleriaceae bacterium]|nr:hypothetical protein [Kofleriaceae bacterium]
MRLARAALRRGELRARWWQMRGRWLAWGGALGLVMGLVTGGGWMSLRRFGASPGRSEPERRAATAHVVRKMTYELYPRWLASHGAFACPRATDLAALAPDTPSVDGWRRRLQIACGSSGVWIRSAGGDGVFGTDDDIVNRWAR